MGNEQLKIKPFFFCVYSYDDSSKEDYSAIYMVLSTKESIALDLLKNSYGYKLNHKPHKLIPRINRIKIKDLNNDSIPEKRFAFNDYEVKELIGCADN